jgi:hypothetical protein
MLPIHKKDIFT